MNIFFRFAVCATPLLFAGPALAGDWDTVAKSPAGRDIITYCRSAMYAERQANLDRGYLNLPDPDVNPRHYIGYILINMEYFDERMLAERIRSYERSLKLGGFVQSGLCGAKRRLQQVQNPGMLSTRTPAPIPPRSPAPATKVPPVRPAKMAPWSPKAMPSDPQHALSPRFAAERADALASCVAPINQWASNGGFSVSLAILLLETNALTDYAMAVSPDGLKAHISVLETDAKARASSPSAQMANQAAHCIYLRRLAQLEGSPLAPGARNGTLNPLSIGQPPLAARKQQGNDARVIASDGKSAMHCVRLEQVASGDSAVSGGGRRLFNGCSEEVEITWCISPNECERKQGNTWTVQPGRSWPISANGTVRWAACLGRDTASFVKDTYGLRYYCSAPAKR